MSIRLHSEVDWEFQTTLTNCNFAGPLLCAQRTFFLWAMAGQQLARVAIGTNYGQSASDFHSIFTLLNKYCLGQEKK